MLFNKFIQSPSARISDTYSQKSFGAKSGEYGGWDNQLHLSLAIRARVSVTVWGDALSTWMNLHPWTALLSLLLKWAASKQAKIVQTQAGCWSGVAG